MKQRERERERCSMRGILSAAHTRVAACSTPPPHLSRHCEAYTRTNTKFTLYDWMMNADEVGHAPAHSVAGRRRDERSSHSS
jgi:hypothetical protein